jgi:hypothetical protein
MKTEILPTGGIKISCECGNVHVLTFRDEAGNDIGCELSPQVVDIT